MRKSTKAAGLLAAATALVGGLAIAPPAQATTTSVFSCNGVHGTAPQNTTLGGGATFWDAVTGLQTSLSSTPTAVKIKIKGDKVLKSTLPPTLGYAYDAGACTSGSLAVSSLKSFAASFSGKIACITTTTYPTAVAPVGTETLTFTTGVDPVTGAAMKSTAAVAISRPASIVLQPDGVKVHGIVTKGVVPGTDLTSMVLQQPIIGDADPQAPGGTYGPQAGTPLGTTPYWDAGASTTPGAPLGLTTPAGNTASATQGLGCQINTDIGKGKLIHEVAISTDGHSLDTTKPDLHSSIAVTSES